MSGDESVRAEKARLRREAEIRRAAAHAEAPDAGDALVAEAAILPAAPIVSAYVAMRSEIDPMPLAFHLAAGGARLALPAIAAKRMEFRLWAPGEPLRPGPFGTREPEGDVVVPGLLLVPLLAFTPAGGRLGYGAGYYDGFLAAHPEAVAVGVAYAVQEVPRLPMEPHDRPLDAVLTDRGPRLFRPERLRGG